MSDSQNKNYLFIDTQQDLDDLSSVLIQASKLAMDTEFVRRSTYYPILSLVQIATETDIYLIDPFKVDDWSGLVQVFDSETQFVMHSCSEDLEVFRAAFGALPKRLIDTQIASAYLGMGDALGYAALVALMCDQDVDKSETQSDWTQRPLTTAQMRYAAEDVRWLIEISDTLEAELEKRNRAGWVEQEVTSLKKKYIQEPEANKSWLKLKGVKRLPKSDWALAKRLCAWREETARRLDKPKSWIVKDNEIMEIISHRPSSTAELSNLSLISPVFVRRNGKAVLSQIKESKALSAPQESPGEELDSGDRKILKSMQQLVSDYSEKHGLAARFVANKQELTNFILYHRNKSSQPSSLDDGWRKSELGEKLLSLI